MSDDSELKARLLADVRAHMAVYGPKKWEMVRARYPEVNERRFFRWTKELREGVTNRGTERVSRHERDHDVVDVGLAIRAEVVDEGAQRARLAAIKNIPAAPSPEYMTRAGIRAEDQINFLAEITRLYRDSEMLRSYGVATDADGVEKLKNPMVFSTSIEKRLRVMDTAVRIMQEVWDLQYMQKFFDEIVKIIVEEIGPAEPELQMRILQRLKELNDRRGMTPHAGMM